MKIINASVSADLSNCSIEEALKCLGTTDLINVILLASSSYPFQLIFEIINKKTFLNNEQIPHTNVDTTEILETDSWMIIDYGQKMIYYSPGA